MRIAAISDLHGHLPEIPECDLLLIAGDICPLGTEPGFGGSTQTQHNYLTGPFREWLEHLNTTIDLIIGVAGNHDFAAHTNPHLMYSLPWHYLLNTATEYDNLNIWGSPYSPLIPGWVFMETDNKLAEHWAKIPNNTDILIVHGPPNHILDKTLTGEHVGSITLRNRLRTMPNLKLFVTGHIHEAHGETHLTHGETTPFTYTQCVNASHVDYPGYNPINKPFIIDL